MWSRTLRIAAIAAAVLAALPLALGALGVADFGLQQAFAVDDNNCTERCGQFHQGSGDDTAGDVNFNIF
jgi:hypothetical protein